MAATTKGDYAAARSAYERMAQSSAAGASLASTGLADLELYRGDYAEAERTLRDGIEKDRETKNTAGLRAKLVQLAETYEATSRARLALDTLREALAVGHEEGVLVPAALMLARARKITEADELAAELDNQLQTQTRAYAKIIDGKLALLNRRRASAIDSFRESIKLTDTWLARFEMGVTYVQAGHFAEALSELETCFKRRGEASALFLDDSPTIRYLATLPYWLARAQEGVGQQAAATTNYEAFLAVRSNADDPLVIDARKRVGN
jgi:tetratricopeptide (TPR) repeat protein